MGEMGSYLRACSWYLVRDFHIWIRRTCPFEWCQSVISRKEILRKVLLLLIVSAVAALYYTYDPSHRHHKHFGFPKCPFYSATHFYCPGCGSQRAIHQLLHGNVFQAASHNLLLVLSVPILLWNAMIYMYNLFSGKKYFFSLLYSSTFAWGLFVSTLLFWIMRNLKTPFTEWLAP